ncbi:hypothetical protein ADINL_0625 [Nitrincola lacisaponensis]|uniref:Uncharacterized protein n=1 Tax=Nitrincola lacisaponensis TaxID=267850 RepID=A0A063Y8D5_9GAMM|nr:hypothetical protein ADINL_0625 [Nitrincola lacisaponensis]
MSVSKNVIRVSAGTAAFNVAMNASSAAWLLVRNRQSNSACSLARMRFVAKFEVPMLSVWLLCDAL